MKKIFVVTAISAVLVFSLFGCSEPADNGQVPDEGMNVYSEMEVIKAESSPVEKALTDLLNMDNGVVANRYEGTFAFGDVTAYDNAFEKLSDDNYLITYAAINKDGSHGEITTTYGTAENVFGNQLMVEDFQTILESMDQLEITYLDSGIAFKYFYTMQPPADGNSFDFVPVEAYYLYLLDSDGSFTGMELQAIYEINDGENHHDFIKTTII